MWSPSPSRKREERISLSPIIYAEIYREYKSHLHISQEPRFLTQYTGGKCSELEKPDVSRARNQRGEPVLEYYAARAASSIPEFRSGVRLTARSGPGAHPVPVLEW